MAVGQSLRGIPSGNQRRNTCFVILQWRPGGRPLPSHIVMGALQPAPVPTHETTALSDTTWQTGMHGACQYHDHSNAA